MALKYKVGDRVRIKSLDWYNENKDEYGYIDCGSRFFFTEMSDLCGKIATIKEIDKTNCYRLEEYDYEWTDEMIEGLVEDEFDLIPKFGEYSDNEPLDVPTMTTEFIKEHGLPCPEGYIFVDENGNEILTSKIILEKKKEYPKTFDKCCHIVQTAFVCDVRLHKGKYYDIFRALAKLIVCRDAYWKIAGDEMGLGKPWEPDFKNGNQKKYRIYNYNGNIKKDAFYFTNSILAFPTEEMRDAFYENFKELIESVKELL